MAKKIKLELTELEFIKLLDIVDTLSAMLGTGDESFDGMSKSIKKVDKMLIKNGFKRKYK